MNLVTPQTSAEGKKVHQVLVAEDVYYPGDSEPEEYYISVLLNRVTGKNMVMYSTEGGMDIETVAEETPHLIFHRRNGSCNCRNSALSKRERVACQLWG